MSNYEENFDIKKSVERNNTKNGKELKRVIIF